MAFHSHDIIGQMSSILLLSFPGRPIMIIACVKIVMWRNTDLNFILFQVDVWALGVSAIEMAEVLMLHASIFVCSVE